jgi:hypothetical protein
MDPIVLERAAIATPVKRRRRFRRKHLALAGLALVIALGSIGHGRYWWTTGLYRNNRRRLCRRQRNNPVAAAGRTVRSLN